jgi:hypothetical protein
MIQPTTAMRRMLAWMIARSDVVVQSVVALTPIDRIAFIFFEGDGDGGISQCWPK